MRPINYNSPRWCKLIQRSKRGPVVHLAIALTRIGRIADLLCALLE